MQTSIASLPMCASWRPNLLPPARWFVVDAGAITHIDYTARGGLKELDEDLAQRGVMLVFAHLNQSLKADLDSQGLAAAIGPNQQFETLRECVPHSSARATEVQKPEVVQNVSIVIALQGRIRQTNPSGNGGSILTNCRYDPRIP